MVSSAGGPSKDYATGSDRWHDGRPVLEGFALDPLGVPTDKWWVE